MNRKRYLVFSSIGDERNVNFWITKDRIYDVCVAYYGKSNIDHMEGADYFIKNEDFKIPNFLRCFEKYDELARYDYYYLIDDDLVIDQHTIEQTFRAARKHRLDLCQPSASHLSAKSHWRPYLTNKEGVYMQYTNFVEIRCFCISRGLLQKTLPYFYLIKSGAGLDLIFSKVLEKYRERIAVFHFLQFTHPYRPEVKTVRGLIPGFGRDYLMRDKRIRFSLRMPQSELSLIEQFGFKVYKTVCKKDARTFLKFKYLLANMVPRN